MQAYAIRFLRQANGVTWPGPLGFKQLSQGEITLPDEFMRLDFFTEADTAYTAFQALVLEHFGIAKFMMVADKDNFWFLFVGDDVSALSSAASRVGGTEEDMNFQAAMIKCADTLKHDAMMYEFTEFNRGPGELTSADLQTVFGSVPREPLGTRYGLVP